MGSVVGEKIRIIENAIKKIPPHHFYKLWWTRMQEGIMSLMQMAKTSAAHQKLSEKNPIYRFCDPTTGGTSASFAMLGDINIAEPALMFCHVLLNKPFVKNYQKGFNALNFYWKKACSMVQQRQDMRKKLGTLIKLLSPHYEKVKQ